MNEYIEIQENLFEYFENTNDKVFVEFIKLFVYKQESKNEEANKLFEQFLTDNGIRKAYDNYQQDLENPTSFFTRSSMSERNLIEQIKQGLLSVAFNKLQKYA